MTGKKTWYYVEYRQRYTGDNLRNGVILTWCDDGGNNATVLDARPGEAASAGGAGTSFAAFSTGTPTSGGDACTFGDA